MIRFPCPHCGAKFKVPETQAGKEGPCPRCKERLTVPPAPEPELELVRDETTGNARTPSKLLDQVAVHPQPLPVRKGSDTREDQRAQELLAWLGSGSASKHTGERKVAWPIDILLYPASMSGIIALLILGVLPLVLQVLPFGFLIGGRGVFFPGAAIGLYACWYLAECVYDSAKGGTRAPEIMDADTSLDELWSRGSYLIAVYLLFVGPAVLYLLFTRRMDGIFWALVAWAIFFFPMGLLAMVIHDSSFVLNPLFLLGSIFGVFVPYVCLLSFTAALAGLFWYVGALLSRGLAPQWLWLFHTLIASYAALIMAHILGRFYWRHRERFDWGI
jgi:hypothetical protein